MYLVAPVATAVHAHVVPATNGCPSWWLHGCSLAAFGSCCLLVACLLRRRLVSSLSVIDARSSCVRAARPRFLKALASEAKRSPALCGNLQATAFELYCRTEDSAIGANRLSVASQQAK